MLPTNIIHRHPYRPGNLITHTGHDSTHRSGANDYRFCLDCLQILQHRGRLLPNSVMAALTYWQAVQHKQILTNPTLQIIHAWIILSEQAHDRQAEAWLAGYVSEMRERMHEAEKFLQDNREAWAEMEGILGSGEVDTLVELVDRKCPSKNDEGAKGWFEVWAKLLDDGKKPEEVGVQRLLQYAFTINVVHGRAHPDGERGLFNSLNSDIDYSAWDYLD